MSARASSRRSPQPLQSLAFFMTAQAVALVAGLALQVWTARTLSPADYGRFLVAHSLSLAIQILLASGIPNALRQLVANSPGLLPLAWRHILLLQIPLSLAAAMLLVCSASWLGWVLNDDNLTVVLQLVSVEVALRGGLLEPCWYLMNGAGWHKLQAALMGLHAVLRLICVACLLVASPTLLAAVLGLVLSATGSVLLGVGAMYGRKCRARIDAPSDIERRLREHLLRWLRLAPLAETLSYLTIAGNVWMLRAGIADHAEVGRYGACFALAQAVLPLGQVLSRACFSEFAQCLGSRDFRRAARLLSVAIRVAILVGGLAIALVVLYGDAVLWILYGSEYAGLGKVMAVLCMGTSVMALYGFLAEMLCAGDRLRPRLVISLGLAVGSLPLTYLFVLWGGTSSAAWGLVITGLAATVSAGGVLHHIVGPYFPAATLLRATGAAALALAIQRLQPWFFPTSAQVWSLPAVVFCYGAALACFGQWQFRDRLSVHCHAAPGISSPKGRIHD